MNIEYIPPSGGGIAEPLPASYFQLFQPVVYEYRIIGINTGGIPGLEQQHQLDKAAAEGFTFLYGRDNYILLSRTVAPS